MTLSGPMSKTPTMRAMKARMVLKFRRPILHEPSTSKMMSALAVDLHLASVRMEERAVRGRPDAMDTLQICPVGTVRLV